MEMHLFLLCWQDNVEPAATIPDSSAVDVQQEALQPSKPLEEKS